jgi:hypothetical protein
VSLNKRCRVVFAAGVGEAVRGSQSYITTDSQSVCLGVEPNLGLLTRDIFFFFLKVTVLSFGGALSDERSGLSFVSLL